MQSCASSLSTIKERLWFLFSSRAPHSDSSHITRLQRSVSQLEKEMKRVRNRCDELEIRLLAARHKVPRDCPILTNPRA